GGGGARARPACPGPPYFVPVGSEVRRYVSYSFGQLPPQTLGSIVSSVTSTTRTKDCRASCLRSKMLVRSARSRTVSPATAAKASTTKSHVRLTSLALLHPPAAP